MSAELSKDSTLINLTKSIDSSKHKDLIWEGSYLFSQFLEGKPVETERLMAPAQKSLKVVGEDLEKQMLSNSDDNEEGLRMNRFVGKCMKRKMFMAAGEDIDEKEKDQLKDDTKYLMEHLLKCLDL